MAEVTIPKEKMNYTIDLLITTTIYLWVIPLLEVRGLPINILLK